MVREAYPHLFPADIGAKIGGGPLRWFSENLIEPKTDRVHFFLIADYLPWDDDYVILESIGKGIAIGRLSFYEPEDIEIYRVILGSDARWTQLQRELRRRVIGEMSKVGRARYDYILILQILLGALNLLLKGKLPPWRAEDFPYGRNKAYICTEAANYGWRAVGHPVITPGQVPLPAGYKQALQEHRLRRIYPPEYKEVQT